MTLKIWIGFSDMISSSKSRVDDWVMSIFWDDD